MGAATTPSVRSATAVRTAPRSCRRSSRSRRRVLGEVLCEFEGGLLTAHLALEFADPLGDAVDPEDVLDAVGHVLGDRYLDFGFRITAPFLGSLGDIDGILELVLEPLEVLFVFGAHLRARGRVRWCRRTRARGGSANAHVDLAGPDGRLVQVAGVGGSLVVRGPRGCARSVRPRAGETFPTQLATSSGSSNAIGSYSHSD